MSKIIVVGSLANHVCNFLTAEDYPLDTVVRSFYTPIYASKRNHNSPNLKQKKHFLEDIYEECMFCYISFMSQPIIILEK